MEFNYLWIDSLCIVQDPSKEWVNESSRMKGVYMYDVSTIATPAALHSTSGCFFDREPDVVRTFKVHARLGEKDCNLDVFGTAETVRQSMMDDTPLSRYAPAFQE